MYMAGKRREAETEQSPVADPFDEQMTAWLNSVGGVEFEDGEWSRKVLLTSGKREIVKSKYRIPLGGRMFAQMNIAIEIDDHVAFSVSSRAHDDRVSEYLINIERVATEEDLRAMIYRIHPRTYLIMYGTTSGTFAMGASQAEPYYGNITEKRRHYLKWGLPGGACVQWSLPSIDMKQTIMAMRGQIDTFLEHPDTFSTGTIPVPLVAAS
jgi:hypothetical protein